MNHNLVAAMMTRRILAVAPETTLSEAMGVMSRERASSVVVMESEQAVGVITERDAVRALSQGTAAQGRVCRELMSAPVLSVSAAADYREAYHLISERGIRHLLVTDQDGSVIGMLTEGDIMRHLGVEYFISLRNVGAAMTRDVVMLPPEAPLSEALQAMAARGIGCVVVATGGKPIGVFSECDAVGFSADGRDPAGVFLGAAINAPLRTVLPECSLHEAVQTMAGASVRRLVVVDAEGSVAGILTQHDVIKGLEGRYLKLLKETIARQRRELAENRRALNRHLLADRIVQSAADAVIIVADLSARIIFCNPAAESAFGHATSSLAGLSLHHLFDEAGMAPPDFDGLIERFRVDPGAHRMLVLPCQGRHFDLSSSGLHDENGALCGLLLIGLDMMENKAVERHLEYLFYHDSLTGLPNRTLLRDRLEQALMHATRQNIQVALLSVDIDLFKYINDTLGHSIGDQLLTACGQRIQEALRTSDTIARYAGDQFLIMLPAIRHLRAVSTAAKKILASLHDPFRIEGSSLAVTASIGISLFPDDGLDYDALVKSAEAAMVEAKQAGRDTCRFFDAAMNRRSREQTELQARLRLALDNGEFVLHYQPQFDIASGRVIGVEALLRWRDPVQGLVMPGQFVPLAEENGLIVPIGAWVLRQACSQAAAWEKAGHPPVTMAVNLSALQFRRGDLFQTVSAALRESGLNPARLELEFTESILVHETEQAANVVRELKALGVQLSIDDFGTGYSSLAYLKRFAVDKLKIDRSFVCDLETDLDDAAIVRAIVQMGHSLKLRVIAEGVETDRQLHMLKLVDCDEVQGFYFSRPLPPEELEPMLTRASTTARAG
ncbi:MAG: EAL domain-containing protein [Candidatus Nitricoxidivorans perseverans]|uniref:EAL domain-containing protein n=1 Tax=Candidatus Nitricoxidivorans perseverans TaxID=2975601 RepID=A0AA49FMX2_9PROT|nr:MAG: EAL domain-containing protein [Candidatus Nitricoxidivorans perseverans]